MTFTKKVNLSADICIINKEGIKKIVVRMADIIAPIIISEEMLENITEVLEKTTEELEELKTENFKLKYEVQKLEHKLKTLEENYKSIDSIEGEETEDLDVDNIVSISKCKIVNN